MVSIQQVLNQSARNVRKEQKFGRERIKRQIQNRQPIGPQILDQRLILNQRSDMIGNKAREVSPNLPRKRQVIVQVNNRKFGE